MEKKQKICKSCFLPFSPSRSRMVKSFCSASCYYKAKNPRKETKVEFVESPNIVKKIKFKEKVSVKEKTKPERDKEYMSFVREFPCLICQKHDSIHAHHTEYHGLSSKGSDYSCIPLCFIHHNGDENKSIHGLGVDKFQQTYNINIEKEVIKLLRKYIKHLKGK